MAAAFSMLGIMNAALLSQGYDEIIAQNDGSDEWRVLSRNWPIIVEAELEDGNYHFTRRQANLLTRQDGLFGFKDAYVLPINALHVRSLWLETTAGMRDLDVLWGQDGERVFVDCPNGVFIDYVEAATESLWSANFAKGVQFRLEAVLSRVKEEPRVAMGLEEMAMDHFDRARKNSSRSRQMVPAIRKGVLSTARFGR